MNAFVRIVVACSLLAWGQPAQAGWLSRLLVGSATGAVATELTAQVAIRAAAAAAVTAVGTRTAAPALANLASLVERHPFIGRGLLLTALANIVHNDPTLRGNASQVGHVANITAAEIDKRTATVTVLARTTAPTGDPRCDDGPGVNLPGAGNRSVSHPGQRLPPERYINRTVVIEDAGHRFPVHFDVNGWPDFAPYSKADLVVADTAGFFRSSHQQQLKKATQTLRENVRKGMPNPFPPGSNAAHDLEDGLGKIDGYTWHHHQDPGRMQLVDENVHNIVKHYGGWYANQCMQTNKPGGRS